MADELLLMRKGNALVPVEPISDETLKGYKNGEMLTATIRRTRNPKHLALFWVLVKRVFEAQDRYATEAQLVNAIKIGVGLYEQYDVTIRGIRLPIAVPGSISFGKMGQTEFSQFYDKAIGFIITEILPGVNEEDLRQEVMSLINQEE